jgi:WD40 repeat protein
MEIQTTFDLKLEHGMGYNGLRPNTLILHPNLIDYLYIAGGVIILAEMNDPNKQKILRGHDDVVTCIALSHNGDLLASGQRGENSDIFVWDYKTGNIIYTLSEHDYEVSCLSFSYDDRLLFSCGNIKDKRSFIWDMKTGNIVLNLTPMFPLPTIFAIWGGFVRDERGNETRNYQYATCGDNQVCLWNVDPYQGTQERGEVQTGNFVRNYICLAFSKNEEKYLYAGTTSGDIVCILVKNRSIVFNKIICAQGVTAIVPLTKYEVVVGGGDGSLVLLYIDEPKCEELARISLYGSIYSLSASQDGFQLLASTDKGFIYRIRAIDLSNIVLNENHTDAIINFYNLNDDHYRFGTCSLDGTIRIWNLDDYSVSTRIKINPSIIPQCLEFNDDMIISGWSDGNIRCYRTYGEEQLWQIDNAHKGGVSAITMNSQSKFVVTGGYKGEVRLWEIRSKEMVSNLKEHLQKVTKVELFKDDIHLMTTSKDKSILIWDISKEKRIASYQLSSGGVNNFRISPIDENIIISVGQDRKITQWDLRYPQPIKVISSNPYGKMDQADELFGLAISNDGKYVTTGGSLGIIRTYEMNGLKFLSEYYAHSKTCSGIAYTFDNNYLISTGYDSLILSFITPYNKEGMANAGTTDIQQEQFV